MKMNMSRVEKAFCRTFSSVERKVWFHKGTLTELAQETGVNRSTLARHRRRLEREWKRFQVKGLRAEWTDEWVKPNPFN